jgi:hypothetical protein
MTAIPCLNAHCNKFLGLKDYADTMTREWIRLAITDCGFIYGVFLSSCRHLSQSFKNDPIEGEQHYMQLATEYKLACLRTVINALPTVQSTIQVDYTTIAKAMLLGLDEVSLRRLFYSSAGQSKSLTDLDLDVELWCDALAFIWGNQAGESSWGARGSW